MFGEFILISGGMVISALISKGLEVSGKNKEAKILDFTINIGASIYFINQLNKLFKEISKF